jgi:hypothetical protein
MKCVAGRCRSSCFPRLIPFILRVPPGLRNVRSATRPSGAWCGERGRQARDGRGRSSQRRWHWRPIRASGSPDFSRTCPLPPEQTIAPFATYHNVASTDPVITRATNGRKLRSGTQRHGSGEGRMNLESRQVRNEICRRFAPLPIALAVDDGLLGLGAKLALARLRSCSPPASERCAAAYVIKSLVSDCARCS